MFRKGRAVVAVSKDRAVGGLYQDGLRENPLTIP